MTSAGLADIISMNPCTVQKHTELEYYWKRGAYRPPYLWSVLAALLSATVPVHCDPVGGGRARGPHNCGRCDYEIVSAIREYNLTADRQNLVEAFETGCECREEWESVLSLEKPYLHAARLADGALWISSCFSRRGRNVPASLTTPIACIVPRSISFVRDEGLISTQMVFT